jgi:hypothetical protein
VTPTSTPTLVSVVLGMVEAIRRIGRPVVRDEAVFGPHPRCPACGRIAVACDEYPHDYCAGRDARAALATWEQRPRLRDDGPVYEAVKAAGFFEQTKLRPTEAAEFLVKLLDAIDDALFGTGPHPGGEPAKEKGRG